MRKGPATRPVDPGDAEALQSALTRAREQAAAPVPPPNAPEPSRPGRASRVEETEPVAGSTVQGGRGARSFRLEPRRRKKAKEKSADGGSPDPRGRGRRVDLRV